MNDRRTLTPFEEKIISDEVPEMDERIFLCVEFLSEVSSEWLKTNIKLIVNGDLVMPGPIVSVDVCDFPAGVNYESP